MTMSLRTRLLAGMALVATVLVIVSIVITVSTRDLLLDQVDQRLTSFSPPLMTNAPSAPSPEYDINDAATDGETPPPPSGGFDRVSDAYEGFITPDGELVTRFNPNTGDPSEDTSPPDVSGDDVVEGESHLLTVSSQDGDTTYRVLIRDRGDVATVTALPLDDVQDTITRLIWVEVLGSLAILATLGVVSWWVLHLGIRPVKEMTETATKIADGDLTVRVPETAPGTESGDLAIALNQMLGRITDAMSEQQASEDRLRRFVADASHELRTPVTTIRGYAELYRHGGLAEPSALDDAMRRTEQEATRMGRLVEDMLLLAKFDDERPLTFTPVDIAVLARDAVADARIAAPDRDVTLSAVPVEGSAVVRGDEDRLRQVLNNVIGNALVHTDAAIEVAVTNGDAVELTVRDHGEGMTPEVADRVTERFFRADPARSRHRGGSGLGLAIVDATVAAHGGSVAIDSAVGAGTTVTLTFPKPSEAPGSASPTGN